MASDPSHPDSLPPFPDDRAPSESQLEPELDPTPPNRGFQLLQLVAIPALIVLASVAIILPIASMASSRDTIENQLLLLKRGGGLSQDRWLAAYRLATMIPSIGPGERAGLHQELVRILEQTKPEEEGKLHRFLVLSISMLGQPDSLEVVLRYADHPHDEIRHGVTQALRQWSDPGEARGAIGSLVRLAGDKNPEIAGLAASSLGLYGNPDDPGVLEALRLAMHREHRELAWDAAIALAKLGDDEGSGVVAGVLLDRQVLSEGQAEASGTAQADRIMLATLSSAAVMTDERIWNKIKFLADKDSNRRVRTMARQLLYTRQWPAQEPAKQ